MTSLFALRALFFSGELLAGSTLLMAFGWLFASQKNASARHLVWVGAFGAALALPLLAAILPSPLRIVLAAGAGRIPLHALNEAARAAVLPDPVTAGISLAPASLVVLLGALWLAGVCVLALRFAAAAICLVALRRRSRPFALAPENLPRIAATRRECELRLSDTDSGPITWGVLRPVILLPRTATFWPRERMSAVLLHELAHIRRRDSLSQALSQFVCALYWPNPLVWIAARRQRQEAEIAADDAAIVCGLKPSRYAGQLLQLAAEFQTRRPAFALSLFMAERSALEARVVSVLAPDALRTGVAATDVVKAGCAGLIAAMVIAFACPSLAQGTAAVTSPSQFAPPAPPTPPEPPEPPAPPAPPAPPTAPVSTVAPYAAPRVAVSDVQRRVNRKCLHAAIARAMREARVAIARTELDRAAAQMAASDETMRAVHERAPEIAAATARAEREVRDAMARARPEIERAIAQAKAGEQAARAVRESQPAIDSAVNAALAKARDELAKANIDAKIEVRVDEAMKRAEIRIDAARLRAVAPSPAAPANE